MKRRFAIGDVHGCIRTLKYLTEKMLCIKKDDEIFFTGDYIDRGPGSRQVLDYLIQIKAAGYKLGLVRGNHEEMLLQAYRDPERVRAWFYNGAEYSLQSFGLGNLDEESFSRIRKIPVKYIEFLQNLPYFIETEDYIICHAGMNFILDDPFADKTAMLWTRDFKADPEKTRGKILIHGHTPRKAEGLKNSLENHMESINLDTGCVYKNLPGYGFLTGFDMDKRECLFVPNMD